MIMSKKDMLCLVVKVPVALQASLVDDSRIFLCKYGARHGWTSIKVDGKTNWKQAEALVVGSYRLMALKGMVAELDGKKS